MKKSLYLFILMGGIFISAQAQDDDIYFVPSSKPVAKSQTSLKSNYSEIPATDNAGMDYDNWADGRYSGRDVDEYNRRGQQENNNEQVTVVEDAGDSYQYENDGSCVVRIIRFHSPRPGFYVSSPFYYDYYDTFYDPWWGSYAFDPWGWRGWHAGYYGWAYDPWYSWNYYSRPYGWYGYRYGWGWNYRPYYGWGNSWAWYGSRHGGSRDWYYSSPRSGAYGFHGGGSYTAGRRDHGVRTYRGNSHYGNYRASNSRSAENLGKAASSGASSNSRSYGYGTRSNSSSITVTPSTNSRVNSGFGRSGSYSSGKSATTPKLSTSSRSNPSYNSSSGSSSRSSSSSSSRSSSSSSRSYSSSSSSSGSRSSGSHSSGGGRSGGGRSFGR